MIVRSTTSAGDRERPATRHGVTRWPIGAVIVASFLTGSATADDEALVYAKRPSAPYRVWYGAGIKHTGVTIGTGGRVDPRLMEAHGKVDLQWVYGTQISWEAGPQYWAERCGIGRRTIAADPQYPRPFVAAGIALDEWIGAKYPDVFDWIVDGLHQGREANPEIFIAIWANGWNEHQLYDLGLDNTVDLYLTQGYTKAPRKGWASGWTDAVREVEELAQRGLIRKTVLAFGHMTDIPHIDDGSVWTEAELREKMQFLKDEFPEMPGVAFFTGKTEDPEKYQALIDLVGRLSREYWPDDWIPDGVYAITPQQATKLRVDLGGAASPGIRVEAHASAYPETATHQQWRFKRLSDGVYRIHPAAEKSVSLCATDGYVELAESRESDAQKWRLTPAPFGFRLSPLSAPGKCLRFASTEGGATLTLAERADDDAQLFALTPEICALDPIPPHYQAEAAEMSSGVTAEASSYGHMGGYASLPASRGDTLTFRAVDGLDGGVHEIVIRYALDAEQPRRADLTVNEQTFPIRFQPTGSRHTWRQFRIRCPLTPGPTNTLTITTTAEDPGDIDKITVRPND